MRGGLSLLLVFKLLLASGFFSHNSTSTAMAPNAHNFAPMPAAEEAAAGQLAFEEGRGKAFGDAVLCASTETVSAK
ncbi:hypothetical protein THAOC_00368, partial [Thalassiosira oceanica]